MKRSAAALALSLTFAVAPLAHAGFMYGEETKGVKISSGNSDMTLRVRLQPRLDYGDTTTSRDGKYYTSSGDFYLRRARIEAAGNLLADKFKYGLVLSADKWDKAGNSNQVKLFSAYAEWVEYEGLNVIAGKEKLPYSRVSLTSSSKQLLIERPSSTEAAKNVFGSSDAYYQPKLGLRGRLVDGAIRYEIALADGWQSGETIRTGRTVLKGGALYAVRVEVSPPGLAEKTRSDAPLGKGKHITFGLNAARQSGIEYREASGKESRDLFGFDLSAHFEHLTAQFEYIWWSTDTSDPAFADSEPFGYYLQGGYYFSDVNVEPVARYEVYDQNSKASDRREKNTTIGVNWYGKGHSLKLGFNWVLTKYEANATGKLANDDTKSVFQFQAQFYF